MADELEFESSDLKSQISNFKFDISDRVALVPPFLKTRATGPGVKSDVVSPRMGGSKDEFANLGHGAYRSTVANCIGGADRVGLEFSAMRDRHAEVLRSIWPICPRQPDASEYLSSA
jgi:hypothetical protein